VTRIIFAVKFRQVMGSPRAVSEARVGKKGTGARRVCALSIQQRHEESRPVISVDAALCKFNGGKERC